MLIIPVLSLAQGESEGLIPCGTTANPTPCDLNSFMALIYKIINFILFKMALPIAAIMFAYAGFELVSSGGSTEKRGVAKSVFTDAVIGLIIAVAAFLIVKTILSILGYQGAWIGF